MWTVFIGQSCHIETPQTRLLRCLLQWPCLGGRCEIASLCRKVTCSHTTHGGSSWTTGRRPWPVARRHILGWEQWTEHVKKLPSLKEGDNVFLQNLMGNHPRRWDRTGRVIECKEYDQYLVKVDGSGRATLRNRKHLRKFKPVPKAPTTQIPPPTHVIQDTPPTRGLSLEYRTTPPSPTHSMVRKLNVATPEDDTPPFIHVQIPDQSQESSQLPPSNQQPLLPVSDPPEQPPHTVTDQPDAQDPLPNSGRPMRVRKQNIKLNPDEWDLSVIVEFLDVVKKLGVRLQGEGLKGEGRR